jgi:hypothetical protein
LAQPVQPSNRPVQPFGLLSPPDLFFHLLHRSRGMPPPLASATSQHRLGLAHHGTAARASHCICRSFPPPPLFIPQIKQPLNRVVSSPIYHQSFLHLNHWPPPPPQPLYIGRASPPSTAPLSAPLLFSLCPSAAHTKSFLRHFFTTIPSPFFLSHGEVPRIRAPFDRPLASHCRGPVQGPSWTGTAHSP